LFGGVIPCILPAHSSQGTSCKGDTQEARWDDQEQWSDKIAMWDKQWQVLQRINIMHAVKSIQGSSCKQDDGKKARYDRRGFSSVEK
jgi:hypothetical protein